VLTPKDGSEGNLYGPNPSATEDMEQAIESLKKLLTYEIDTIVCYHGGVVKGNIHDRLLDIIDNKTN